MINIFGLDNHPGSLPPDRDLAGGLHEPSWKKYGCAPLPPLLVAGL